MKNQAGFSILEFTVSMTVLVLIFAAVMSVFVPLLQKTKLEAGLAQNQMENIVGLEMMRADIVHAGHGLPWSLSGLAYAEVATNPHALNDASNPPRALAFANNVGVNGSDYVVVKSNNVAVTDVSQKISFIQQGPLVANLNPRIWGRSDLDFADDDRVIVMRLMDPDEKIPMMIEPQAGAFYTTWGDLKSEELPAGGFANEVWYVFGLTPGTVGTPRMPFNRADFYISTVADRVPARCIANTGVLVKSVVDQATGALGPELPILDCVADFQIAFGVDTTTPIPDKSVDCVTNNIADVLPAADLSPNTIARTIRERVREVRIYILAQEGLFQYEYDFNEFDAGGTKVRVGEENNPAQICAAGPDDDLGSQFDMSTLTSGSLPDGDFRNYRWRVHRIVIQPENLTRSLFGGDQQQ